MYLFSPVHMGATESRCVASLIQLSHNQIKTKISAALQDAMGQLVFS